MLAVQNIKINSAIIQKDLLVWIVGMGIPQMGRRELQFGTPRRQRHWGCVICCVTAGKERI